MADLPRTVDQIYEDYVNRRNGLTKALTEDVDDFYQQCDPERENLCLYGEPNGSWLVDLPAEEVPPELPEPCLGINFARDGMQKKDWLALVAVHSDAWLLAVAFFYAVKLDQNGRAQLHKRINQMPTLFELVTNRANKVQRPAAPPVAAAPSQPPQKRRKPDTSGGPKQLGKGPTHPGRLLRIDDVTNALKGRHAELFWPDDGSWYEVEIQQVNTRQRSARIVYTSGEVEDLDLEEICNQGHMSLIT